MTNEEAIRELRRQAAFYLQHGELMPLPSREFVDPALTSRKTAADTARRRRLERGPAVRPEKEPEPKPERLCCDCKVRPAVGKSPRCDECRRAYRKAYNADRLDRQRTGNRTQPQMSGRHCPDCGRPLPRSHVNAYCCECIAARCRRGWEDAVRR